MEKERYFNEVNGNEYFLDQDEQGILDNMGAHPRLDPEKKK